MKKFGVFAATTSALWFVDSEWNAKTMQRNFRTLWNGLCITYDYKFNFKEGADVNEIHQRTANRILSTCQNNGGLYIKFGQGVASMNHILPPAYNDTLKPLFQDAPTIPYAEVLQLFQEEFGRGPEDLFEEFDPNPIASASIAQVHRAKMKSPDDDGVCDVAVKIQKPSIRKQLFWDMLGYKIIIFAFEKLFDLPLMWSAEFTERHLRDEVDFLKEADNSEKAAVDFAKEPNLAQCIYIPKVMWSHTTSRILTCEWIEGISLAEPDQLSRAGFSLYDIMHKVISAFSYQIFQTGFVHADPHIGNILIRKHPDNSNSTQVCLLDHGLYVQESEEFRKTYAKFWKYLFLLDMDKLKQICTGWGINDVDIFASATLQRPYNSKKAVHLGQQTITAHDVYKMQMVSKERIKNFLANTEKTPKELIFVGRNLNMVRSNNKHLGSPVNRVNIMAEWAVKNEFVGESKRIKDRMLSNFNYWIFQTRLFVLSISFYLTRITQVVGQFVTGKRWSGFEDVLDQQTISTMRNKLGIVVNPDAFNA